MAKAREVTKEEEGWIKDNLRYDPETGHLWWLKQNVTGPQRDLDRPAGYKGGGGGYLRVKICLFDYYRTIFLHRVAWFLYHGVWPKDFIDHINNIRDDNRILNLREATRSENNRNAKAREGGTSQYKGVFWYKKACKWQVMIQVNHKRIHLGLYHNEEEAALAYNKSALEHFGKYAKINVIEPLDTRVISNYISSSSGKLTC